MSLVGIVSFLKKRFIFIPWASPCCLIWTSFAQHNSSKFAQRSDVYCLVGTLKSCLCLRTNFTHFPLTVGIVRELKHSMPGAGTIYSDSFAGQSRGTSNTISPSLSRIFQTIRHTEFDLMSRKWRQRFLVKWYFGCAIRIPFLRGKWHNFKSFQNCQFYHWTFKLRKSSLQMINFITTI